MAMVDYRQFDKQDSEAEMIRKLEEWYKFCKETAKQALHPPWANNGEFKEVCVKDHKAISIRKVYDVWSVLLSTVNDKYMTTITKTFSKGIFKFILNEANMNIFDYMFRFL